MLLLLRPKEDGTYTRMGDAYIMDAMPVEFIRSNLVGDMSNSEWFATPSFNQSDSLVLLPRSNMNIVVFQAIS
jgi:hypothetical protein